MNNPGYAVWITVKKNDDTDHLSLLVFHKISAKMIVVTHLLYFTAFQPAGDSGVQAERAELDESIVSEQVTFIKINDLRFENAQRSSSKRRIASAIA